MGYYQLEIKTDYDNNSGSYKHDNQQMFTFLLHQRILKAI